MQYKVIFQEYDLWASDRWSDVRGVGYDDFASEAEARQWIADTHEDYVYDNGHINCRYVISLQTEEEEVVIGYVEFETHEPDVYYDHDLEAYCAY